MKTDLLLKLADMLEADAANPEGIKFDLRSWIRPSDLTYEAYENLPMNCGTTACAMGLAALSGQFEGLSYTGAGNVAYRVSVTETKYGFDAVEVLFDVSFETAAKLFSKTYYPVRLGAEAELLVAKRIRTLVTQGNLDEIPFNPETVCTL